MKERGLAKAVSVLTAALLLLAPFFGPVAAFSQTANTGVITGVVRDQTGAVVSDATVRAINKATGVKRETTTGSSGAFELGQLVPGDYRLEVEAKGFGRFVAEQVTVAVLARVTVEPDLKAAGATEQVTVTGESAPLVETSKSDVSGVIDPKQMESLPVNGRSFASLAPLIPGATLAPSFDPTKARVGSFSIGGSTGRNLNITIDGGDNKDNAVGGILQNFTMEGIQEFALSTQRFSAANGRSGGALLSVVNKSGSNALHGSAFGFFRSDVFNANAPQLLADVNPELFPDPADIIKPPFDRQQFGGSIGGPFIKDKLFWFAAVEHTRERGNSLVPGQAFNQIQLLEPLGYSAVRFLAQPFNDTQWTIKTDYNPAPNHSITLRYAGQINDGLNDQAGFLIVKTDLSGGNKTLNDLHNGLAGWTWTVSPQLVNQFFYNVSKFDNEILATTDLLNLTFPDGVVVGRNGNVPQQTLQTKHQFRDDLSWNHGKHAFKFGGDFVWEPTLGGLFAFNSAPEYDFFFSAGDIANNPGQFPQGFNTAQIRPGPITCAFAGIPNCTQADLQGLGVVADILLSGGDPKFDLRDGAKQYSAYFQDDWKVTSKLTLNLGVRYDVDVGFVDSAHQKDNRAIRALQIIGNPFGKVAHDDKNNVSPRIGFAWDIRGNSRSVLRGGFGLYYDQSFLNVPLFAVQQANPEIYATFQNVDDNLSLASPPPSIPRPLTNPRPGTRGRLIDPNFESPVTQQTNIGFEQAIGKNASVTVDYIHILGLHEFTGLDINPRVGPLRGASRTDSASSFPRILAPAFAAHASELIAAFGTATPFARVSVAQSDGRSHYDAMTISFKKRYANHFLLNAHYTLSRSKAWFGVTGDFGLAGINPFDKFDRSANFGPSDADERHRFVVSGIFDLPYGIELAPIFQAASARPYSIFPSCVCDINKDGVANDRESRDGNDQHQLPPGTERGDKFVQMNLRVAKNFKFGDRMKLGLYFEAFNLFNTGNYGASFQNVTDTPDFKKPINFFGATGFSEPLGIPFQAQFGFRFSF